MWEIHLRAREAARLPTLPHVQFQMEPLLVGVKMYLSMVVAIAEMVMEVTLATTIAFDTPWILGQTQEIQCLCP
mgnify:CR=1 FL=1